MEKLKFKCGTEIQRIDGIAVRRTYAGLMLGGPDERINNNAKLMFLDMAQELVCSSEPFVIEPEIKLKNGNPTLPQFICSASLNDLEPAKDKSLDRSESVIMWYQESNPILDGFVLIDLVGNYTWAEVSRDTTW